MLLISYSVVQLKGWPNLSIRDKAIFSYSIDKQNVIDFNPGKYLERQLKIGFSSLYLRVANEKKNNIELQSYAGCLFFMVTKFRFSVTQII